LHFVFKGFVILYRVSKLSKGPVGSTFSKKIHVCPLTQSIIFFQKKKEKKKRMLPRHNLGLCYAYVVSTQLFLRHQHVFGHHQTHILLDGQMGSQGKKRSKHYFCTVCNKDGLLI
jgi:hypothetical protein